MADVLPARGPNMEALSPRDVNAQIPPKPNDIKVKAIAQATKQANNVKDKEHPPPPPAQVYEPSSSDRRDGAVYQVGKLLGKGGFAICYEGVQQAKPKKRVALKIVKSKMPAKMEQKFQTELQIHSKMRHANIVKFYRAFAFESCTYLVLELCPNGSLMDMVKRRKGVTEAEVRFYAIQIAGAIKYMHAKGIIHRDLKMGNIFLDRDMNAKIGDFGLAALLVTGKDMHVIRRTTLCGTPNYIAPEILEKGRKGHDHMVDIWSLGVIMFAMLTSKPPFQSTTTDEIYRRAKERDYEWPKPEATQRYISPEAKDLVATMLQEADNRPQPDIIVQHPFFTSGFVPAASDITVRLRDLMPDKAEFLMPRQMKDDPQSLQNLLDLCRDCDVGPWNVTKTVHTKVWREVAAEEKAGRTPMVPLADHVVYRPFDEWLQEQEHALPSVPLPQNLAPIFSEEQAYQSHKILPASLRAPPQSFAAQQRVQNRPLAPAGNMTVRTKTERVPSASELTRRPIREVLTAQSVPEQVPRKTSGSSRTQLPSIRPKIPQVESEPIFKAVTRPKLQYPGVPATSLFSPKETQEVVPLTQPDVVLERIRRLQTELERALNSRSMAIISNKDVEPAHPRIVVKWVDYTNKFGLGYILNDGSVGCILRNIPTNDNGKQALLPAACLLVHNAERHIHRRIDESYVDRHEVVPMSEPIFFYENNGEQGLCRVRVSPENFRVQVSDDGASGKLTVGKDVYDHRKRERLVLWKKFANYMMTNGRDQSGPLEDLPPQVHPFHRDRAASTDDLVTFYQRFGDVGCWVFCDGHLQFNFPDHTKIVLDASGYWCHFWHLPQSAAEHLATTGQLDESALDDRAVLSFPLQTLLNFTAKPNPRATAATARRRPEIPPSLRDVPRANDLRRKVEFIRSVVREWVANGGMGNSDLSRDCRLRWTGCREIIAVAADRESSPLNGDNNNYQAANVGQKRDPSPAPLPQKHVWVTIGARWGDERLSAYVDPRRPAELGADIDEGAAASARRRAGAGAAVDN